MNPALAALVSLQSLDSAIDQSRKRLAELPGLEQTVAARITAAAAAVDAAKARLLESATARRALEKDVAAVDARLARFDDHKASVKTNHEYTALLHEIATAKAEKDAIEEQILVRMEEADGIAQEVKTAEAARSKATADGETTRLAIHEERARMEAESAALSANRAASAKLIDPRALATYDQLLKNRRGIAVARMDDSVCAACHVRLRPAIEQRVRRGDELVPCDNCQRLLYSVDPAAESGSTVAAAAGPARAAAR